MFVSPGSDLLGKDLQGLIEPSGIDPRQNQPFSVSCGGTDKAIQIGPVVAMIDWSNRAFTNESPNRP